MKAILSPADFARESGWSKSWVVERCQDGTLPALRVGIRWLLKRADLIRDGWLPRDDEEAAATGRVAATGQEVRADGGVARSSR